ncbi:MAG: hypothetical protein PUE92_08805 [Catenibacterium mitsuokai]|nr:hypothetical protein [Catenibacterium mitsuokai]MDD6596124.1 hypothetical protein [Catenibacterium mitsuokai]
MTDIKKNDRCGKMKLFVIGSALTLVGFIIVPPLIKKYENKVYKKSLDTDDIDFDDMGPEIVPFEEETKEEE